MLLEIIYATKIKITKKNSQNILFLICITNLKITINSVYIRRDELRVIVL